KGVGEHGPQLFKGVAVGGGRLLEDGIRLSAASFLIPHSSSLIPHP
ncbi:MAG: hypothetical protein IT258_07140, partial [Saprospiraceae bacterium]|nr:hypothetical protein [Saprospiraceae bacterium]